MPRSIPRQLAAALIALALVSFLVVRASSAAFTATTANDANSFAIGDVNLSDNDAGSALFALTGLVPGDSATRCINVTYDGDFTGAELTEVRIYASGAYTDAGTIDGYFNLDIDYGSGATDTSCTGFTEDTAAVNGVVATLADFESVTDYAGGISTTWTPSATSETRSFRITVDLDASAPDSIQGATLADVGFTWEIQTA